MMIWHTMMRQDVLGDVRGIGIEEGNYKLEIQCSHRAITVQFFFFDSMLFGQAIESSDISFSLVFRKFMTWTTLQPI